jgi:hypothetical protein
MASTSGVRHEKLIGKDQDVFVSECGSSRRYPFESLIESGQDQQPPLCRRFLPRPWRSGKYKSASQTEKDGLFAGQEYGEAFLFHGRMETADYRNHGAA